MSYINKLYERSGVKQIAILLMASAMLISCSDLSPDPVCVASDDMGQTTGKTVTINADQTIGSDHIARATPKWSSSATSGWYDTGLEVQSGGMIRVETIGDVSVCSQSLERRDRTETDGNGNHLQEIDPASVCPGTFGKYLNLSIGTAAENAVDLGLCSTSTTNTNVCPSGETATCSCKNGVYKKTPAPTGKVWIRIADENYGGGAGNTYDRFVSPQSAVVPMVSGGTCETTIQIVNSTSCFIPNGTQVTKKSKCVNGECNPDTTITCASMISNVSGTALNCSVLGSTLTVVSKSSEETCSGKISAIASDATQCAIGYTIAKLSSESCASKISTVNATQCRVDFKEMSGSNDGSYLVKLTTTKVASTALTDVVDMIISPVKKLLYGVKADPTATPNPVLYQAGMVEKMYTNIVENSDFVTAVRALMVLAVIFYAFYYMLGLGNSTQKELYYFILKMSVILAMTGENSWEFFSKYLFGLFIEGTDNLMWMMSHNINELIGKSTPGLMTITSDANSGASQGKSVFTFINSTVSLIFSQEANIKLQSILMTFPIGPLLFIVIWIGIFFFLFSLVKGLLTYLIAIIMIAMLLFLAPIFICFLMFNQTKNVFHKWLKQLAGYTLQPALLFVVLAVFNVFIMLSLYNILSFSACFTCIWEIDLPMSEIIDEATGGIFDINDFDKFCAMYGYLPWGIDSSQNVATKLAKTPTGLFYVLIFIILANSMLKFIDWVQQIANNLTGENSAASSASSGAGAAISEATALGKGAATIGIDAAKFAGRNTANLLDKATGHVVSDAAKKVARSALPTFLGKGGSDGMGGKLAFKESLLTYEEKKGLARERKEFNKLGVGRYGARRQEEVMLRNQSRYDDLRSGGKSASQAKNARLDELRKKGTSVSIFGGGSNEDVKSAKELIRREMGGEEGLTLAGVGKERQGKRDAAEKELRAENNRLSGMAQRGMLQRIDAAKRDAAIQQDVEDKARAERLVDFAKSVSQKKKGGDAISTGDEAMSAVRNLSPSDALELRRIEQSGGEGTEGLRRHYADSVVKEIAGDEKAGLVSADQRQLVERISSAAVDYSILKDDASLEKLKNVAEEARENEFGRDTLSAALELARVDRKKLV